MFKKILQSTSLIIALILCNSAIAGHLFSQNSQIGNTPVLLTGGNGVIIQQRTWETGGGGGNISLDFFSGNSFTALGVTDTSWGNLTTADKTWSSGDSIAITIGNFTTTITYQAGDGATNVMRSVSIPTLSPTVISVNSSPTTWATGEPTYQWTVQNISGSFAFEGYRVYTASYTFNGTGAGPINTSTVVSSSQIQNANNNAVSKTNITSASAAGSNADAVFGTSGTHNRVFEGGTLTLDSTANGALTDSNAFTVKTDGTIHIPNSSDTFIFSGGITNDSGATASGLTKTGSGKLVLNGTNTYSGTTTVSAGTLAVGLTSADSASTLTSAVSLSSGATLVGYGTVGTTTSSGTVSPGGSIGTLTVSGNFTQNSSGNYLAGVTPTSHDLLNVTGSASLNGTITIEHDSTATSTSYQPKRYTLITAAGGISGSFSNLDTTSLDAYTSLNKFLRYDANNVYLILGPDSINTVIAINQNADLLRGAFALQSSAQLIGLNYDCKYFGRNNTCWSTGGRTTHSIDSNSGNKHADAAVLIGSYRENLQSRWGFWLDKNLNTQNGNVKLSNDNPMWGLFHVYSPEESDKGLQVSSSISHVRKTIEITRASLANTEPGKGSSVFQGYAAQIKFGYGLDDLIKGALITPSVSLRHSNLYFGAYTESNVQTPISYDRYKQSSNTTILAIRAETRINNLIIFGDIGAENDFRAVNPTYSGTSNIYGLNTFSVSANTKPRSNRNFLNLGLLVEIDREQRISLQNSYRQDAFRGVNIFSTSLNYIASF